MLTIKPTPLLAGLAVSGDYEDFTRLYDALLEVVGEEQEPGDDYEMPAMYILALCYELRQAISGNRAVDFVPNHLDAGAQQTLKTLGPQRNVYFRTRIHLPEILFDIMALSDFIELRSRQTKHPSLDRDIQMAQLFQAEVMSALKSMFDPAAALRLTGQVFGRVPRYCRYCTQYVDLMTARYLQLPPDKRRSQILTLARKFNVKAPDYFRMEAQLLESAAELDCTAADLECTEDLPELTEQEW